MGGDRQLHVCRCGSRKALQGKQRTAFRSGFLGVESLGWSTLVQIVEATPEDRAQVVAKLAQRLMQNFGAPDLASARLAAEEEVSFAQSLCYAGRRYPDRAAPEFREWRVARGVPNLATARRREGRCAPFRSSMSKARKKPPKKESIFSISRRRPASEGFLACLRPPSARSRRGRRARGHRRLPEGLSGAAGARTAAGRLRSREDPACGAAR